MSRTDNQKETIKHLNSAILRYKNEIRLLKASVLKAVKMRELCRDIVEMIPFHSRSHAMKEAIADLEELSDSSYIQELKTDVKIQLWRDSTLVSETEHKNKIELAEAIESSIAAGFVVTVRPK